MATINDRVPISKIKRIAVLTGGGDCPGLNAVIRAVVKDAINCGIEVFGIEDGFLGLIEDRIKPLLLDDVSNILTMGGTILGSNNRSNPQRYPMGKDENGDIIYKDLTEVCVTHLNIRKIEALIVIGGDGTMSVAKPITDHGFNCIGVPKTIDNDLFGTDITFGFQTAVHVATEALDRVHSTAASHHRVMVVELMGRNAGWITLYAGLASGADVILIPEIEFDLDKIAEYCLWRSQRGKRFTIIAVSEGARPKGGEQIVDRVIEKSPDPIRLGGIAKWLATEIETRTEIESRYVVLGHTQRGGTPTAGDRVLATQFGHHAMQLLKMGKTNRLVVMQGGVLGDVDIQSAADKQRLVPKDHPLITAARSVYTSFGD
jgi:ATP-dependent phosphofructokinase / diphosphate-dependent phosphofructokinase